MKIFRALTINKKSKESSYSFSGGKSIKELLKLKSGQEYCNEIHTHLTKGNFYKTSWISFSKNFFTAYGYSRPTVIRGSVMDQSFPRRIKINNSYIAICDYDKSKMFDVTEKDDEFVKKYCKGTAYKFGKNNAEILLLGSIDEYDIMDKFQMDLLYLLALNCERDKDNIVNIPVDIIEKVVHIYDNKNFINRFSILELVVFELFYTENMNLYEIIAPVYDANDCHILNIYKIVFDILGSIFSMILYSEFNVNKEVDCSISDLIKMYTSELNFVCVEHEYSNSENCEILVSFKTLINTYNKVETIKGLIKNDAQLEYKTIYDNKISEHSIYDYTETEYPLYLYLPKNKQLILKEYLTFKKNRDFKFAMYNYKVYKDKKTEYGNISCCTIYIIEDDETEYIEFEYMPNGAKGGCKKYKQNISKFVSEIYIPDSYIGISDDTFEIAFKRYGHLTEEIIIDNYSDLLNKVFGGKNLKLDKDEKEYFKYRRFCQGITSLDRSK